MFTSGLVCYSAGFGMGFIGNKPTPPLSDGVAIWSKTLVAGKGMLKLRYAHDVEFLIAKPLGQSVHI